MGPCDRSPELTDTNGADDGPTGKQKMTGIANKPKSSGRNVSGLTRPGDLYLPGDALPLPDVVEKDTDSVWALWSDTVEQESQTVAKPDEDFKETLPLDFDEMVPTQSMDLPELPDQLNEPEKRR